MYVTNALATQTSGDWIADTLPAGAMTAGTCIRWDGAKF